MIVWVSVVLNRTVVDSDWRFDNLCDSHLKSQSQLYRPVVIDLIWSIKTRNVLVLLVGKTPAQCVQVVRIDLYNVDKELVAAVFISGVFSKLFYYICYNVWTCVYFLLKFTNKYLYSR